MRQLIGTTLLCAALCACATNGSLSSLSNIGSANEPEKPAKPAAAAEPAASPQTSTLGGIWSNFSSTFNSGAQPVAQKPESKPVLDANEALRLVNDFRAKKGLRPLALDPYVMNAAIALAQDMAKHDRMSHVGPNGADVGKRLITAGYAFRVAAENVGVGQATLAETIEGWKKSPPHSRNLLLADATHMGIAYEYKPDTKHKTFWTLVVAAP
jgi:uncharacterized protein YkwD